MKFSDLSDLERKVLTTIWPHFREKHRTHRLSKYHVATVHRVIIICRTYDWAPSVKQKDDIRLSHGLRFDVGLIDEGTHECGFDKDGKLVEVSLVHRSKDARSIGEQIDEAAKEVQRLDKIRGYGNIESLGGDG